MFIPNSYLCGDLILAAESASFQDLGHFPSGVAPGGGIHALWTALIGPVRAKHLLLARQTLTAQEALKLGVVGEVLPYAALMPRARTIARDLARRPIHILRCTKITLNQHFKRLLAEQTELGLALEGYGLIAANDFRA